MEMEIKSFKDLKIWQKAVSLSVLIYSISEKLPSDEKFGITSQVRRAATSVAANIAEGWSRNHTKEFIHFLYISIGSLCELETFMVILKELGYLKSVENREKAIMDIEETRKMIYGMIKSLSVKTSAER